MSHRAGLYKVQVKELRKPKDEARLLGDIDNQGTSLSAVLGGFMANFESVSFDETRIVRALGSTIAGDELRIILQQGLNGVAATIVDGEGEFRLHQNIEDTHLVRCGALFHLPAAQRLGWLAVHVNNNRGVKGLLAHGVSDRFRDVYDDLRLHIDPFVEESVLRQAVEEDKVERVKLVRYERPEDRANAATNKWVPANAIGRLELDITAPGKGNRLIRDRLLNFLRGDEKVFDDIIVFEGMQFDTASVEVEVEDGRMKTFNIENPDAGHAMTQELENLEVDEEGEPTEESLFAALRDALSTVSGPS